MLDNAPMAFRTSIDETGGRVERDLPENCLGGKDEVNDKARVLAIFEMK